MAKERHKLHVRMDQTSIKRMISLQYLVGAATESEIIRRGLIIYARVPLMDGVSDAPLFESKRLTAYDNVYNFMLPTVLMDQLSKRRTETGETYKFQIVQGLRIFTQIMRAFEGASETQAPVRLLTF